MSTLSKETETLSSSIVESAASQVSAQAQPPSSTQVHSDAVSLEVPLKVHGSKVTEVIRGAAPHTEPFEEQTSSMIVFPTGGVLRMATSVNAGQMLVLTNLKSRQDAICRVVKVRNYSGSSSYVEVEFTHRQPGFWGVYFESDSPTAPASPAAPVAPSASAPESAGKNPRQAAPNSAVNSALQPRNESAFIGIGSQEDVQPAASSTSGAASNSRGTSANGESKIAKNPATIAAGESANAAAPPPLNIALNSQGARTQQQEEDASIESEGAAELVNGTGSSANPVLSTRSLTSGAFGSRLNVGTENAEAAEQRKNWLLIAACGAGLFLLLGGAVLLSHHKAIQTPATQAQAAEPSPVSAQTTEAPLQQQGVAPTTPRGNSVGNSAPPPPIRETPPAPARAPKEVAIVTETPAEPEPTAPATAAKNSVPSVFGTLNAHPVSSRQVSAGIAAPNVDATPSVEGNALLGITAPSAPSALPPPGFKAGAALPVGGRVKQPRLLSTSIPEYPIVAKQSHTQGDVVLEIVVDKSGNVTEPKVITGPVILRLAAIDAVRRWKYEPSTLDGQSISVKMLVTIQFRL